MPARLPRHAARPRFSDSQAPPANRDPSISTAIALPWGSRLLEAIADAVERLDHVETFIGLLEFFTQPLDVAVDRAVIYVHLVVVGGVPQGMASFHHPGSDRE